MATAKRASERRSRTLAQQAKSYEVAGEYEMMQVMHESWINGNFSDFKHYYRVLRMEDRRKFVHYLYNNTDEVTFYRMIDSLMFG